MHSFGDLLKGFRRREGLTQETLADQLGVHRNSISDWERNAYLPRTRQMVLDLSEALDLGREDTNQMLYAAEYPLVPDTQESIDTSLAIPHFDPVAEEESDEIEKNVFVAREDELAQLDDFLTDILKDRQGRVVFVQGEPGSGKTALVQEFSWSALEANSELIAAAGSCNAYSGVGDPYLPFREILRLLTYDRTTRWAAESFIRKFAHNRLLNLIPDVVRALVDTGPDLIETFISGPALISRASALKSDDPNWLTPLKTLVTRKTSVQSPANLQQRALFDQYAHVMRALSRRNPLLLVLDDLQWADTGSISLLFHLGKRLKDRPILIIGAYRPADLFLGREGRRHPLEPVLNEFQRDFGQNRIDLKQTMGRQFVEAILDTEPNRLGAAFQSALYEHTRGHALFTIEMLRSMQRRGDLVKDEAGRWIEGPDLDWQTLPARIDGVIRERIERLPKELQNTLKAASVEGEDFLAEVIARVQNVGEWAMVKQLSGILDRQHRLVSSQASRRLGDQRLSRYRFRHILFQHYLYGSLDIVEQAFLHEMVGNTLERLYAGQTDAIAVQLARHFRAAELETKAVFYLSQAGKRAMRLSANEEAVAHFTEAVTLLKSCPESAERTERELDLQTSLGPALIAIKGYAAPEVEKAYIRARELCLQVGKTSQIYPVLVGLWLHYFVRAELPKALEIGQQLLDLAPSEENPAVLLQAHRTLCCTLCSMGEFESSLKHSNQGISLYRSRHQRFSDTLAYVHDPGAVYLAYSAIALWCLGFPDQSLKRSHEALELVRELDHPFSEAFVLGMASFLHHYRREEQIVQVRAESALKIATEKGFSQWLAAGVIMRGWALTHQGQGTEAITPMRQALDGWRGSGAKLVVPYYLLLLAEAYAAVGDAKAGLTTVKEALKAAQSSGECWFEAEMYRLQGEFLLKQDGAEAEIEGCFNKAFDVASHQKAKSLELRIAMSLSRLRQRQGRQAEAVEMLSETYEWFTEGFDTPDLRDARALLGENS